MGGAGDGTGDFKFCLKCEGQLLSDCVTRQNSATGSSAAGFTGYENCDSGANDEEHRFHSCFTTIRRTTGGEMRVWSGCSNFAACNALMNQNFDIAHPMLSQCRPPVASAARFRRPSTCSFCHKLTKANAGDNGIDGGNMIWNDATGKLNYGGNPTIQSLIEQREVGLGAVGQTQYTDDDSADAVGAIYQAHGSY